MVAWRKAPGNLPSTLSPNRITKTYTCRRGCFTDEVDESAKMPGEEDMVGLHVDKAPVW